MKRREFITLLGGAAVTWPLSARAQKAAMPVIGFLNSASPDAFAPFVSSFHRGLEAVGFVDGQNVVIEYRSAEGHPARLPARSFQQSTKMTQRAPQPQRHLARGSPPELPAAQVRAQP